MPVVARAGMCGSRAGWDVPAMQAPRVSRERPTSDRSQRSNPRTSPGGRVAQREPDQADAVSVNAPHGYREQRAPSVAPERTRQVKARDTHGSHRLERQIFLDAFPRTREHRR